MLDPFIRMKSLRIKIVEILRSRKDCHVEGGHEVWGQNVPGHLSTEQWSGTMW